MALPVPVLLAEAATFTCGCMLLRRRWLDPELVGAILAHVAAALALILLLALSLTAVAIDPAALDPSALDPAGIWPVAE